mmetsp:Transcript_57118/g.127507  ORF Transcript_57118/g.127507 Transcript_57118/m.127507 type:complete len:242 (+) Transcript_57118:625-1350(+)
MQVPLGELVVERERAGVQRERLEHTHHRRKVVGVRMHKCPRLVKLTHRLLVRGEYLHPLVQQPMVQSTAHERPELDVRVVGHALVRVDLDHGARQGRLRGRVLGARRLEPFVRRLARLVDKVPDVVAANELEALEAVQQHSRERRAELPAHQDCNVLVLLVVAKERNRLGRARRLRLRKVLLDGFDCTLQHRQCVRLWWRLGAATAPAPTRRGSAAAAAARRWRRHPRRSRHTPCLRVGDP